MKTPKNPPSEETRPENPFDPEFFTCGFVGMSSRSVDDKGRFAFPVTGDLSLNDASLSRERIVFTPFARAGIPGKHPVLYLFPHAYIDRRAKRPSEVGLLRLADITLDQQHRLILGESLTEILGGIRQGVRQSEKQVRITGIGAYCAVNPTGPAEDELPESALAIDETALRRILHPQIFEKLFPGALLEDGAARETGAQYGELEKTVQALMLMVQGEIGGVLEVNIPNGVHVVVSVTPAGQPPETPFRKVSA